MSLTVKIDKVYLPLKRIESNKVTTGTGEESKPLVNAVSHNLVESWGVVNFRNTTQKRHIAHVSSSQKRLTQTDVHRRTKEDQTLPLVGQTTNEPVVFFLASHLVFSEPLKLEFFRIKSKLLKKR